MLDEASDIHLEQVKDVYSRLKFRDKTIGLIWDDGNITVYKRYMKPRSRKLAKTVGAYLFEFIPQSAGE